MWRHTAAFRRPALLGTQRRCATSIKATLNLPKTTFPLYSNPAIAEPPMAPLLSQELYAHQAAVRTDAPLFVLHDGPPYANGDLHMGHFLNKVLKDVFSRWRLLCGDRIHYVPGWDCHGLPIELKALQASGAEAAHALPPLELRSIAAACAREAVASQRHSFLRWGIMADWGGAYTTMQPAYEAAQLGVLREMLQRGLVFRGARPVHWSPASRTALAEAELEHVDDHVSTAAYIAFPLAQAPVAFTRGSVETAGPVEMLIWTTTPWTIPANQAVCANAELGYALAAFELPSGRRQLILAESTLEAVAAALGALSFDVVTTMPGTALGGLRCEHPLSGRQVPLLLAEHVTGGTGTGLVHTAPGHGADDFAVGQAHGLDTTAPVDERGRFTDAVAEAAPFVGLPVLSEGTAAVIKALKATDKLLAADPYTHRYPCEAGDTRTHAPDASRTCARRTPLLP
jgi:isoleucyl-tRNA synthetase